MFKPLTKKVYLHDNNISFLSNNYCAAIRPLVDEEKMENNTQMQHWTTYECKIKANFNVAVRQGVGTNYGVVYKDHLGIVFATVILFSLWV